MRRAGIQCSPREARGRREWSSGLLPAALAGTAQRAQVVKVRFVFEAEDVEDDFVVETEMYDCKT